MSSSYIFNLKLLKQMKHERSFDGRQQIIISSTAYEWNRNVEHQQYILDLYPKMIKISQKDFFLFKVTFPRQGTCPTFFGARL